MTLSPKPLAAEWSHFLSCETVPDRGESLTITASEEECKDLAQRYRILSLSEASATLQIQKENEGRIFHVTGTATATLEQECVITGAPVKTTIVEEVEGWFADPAQVLSFAKARRERAMKEGQELPVMDEKDDPEPTANGYIDLGELVAQHISLAIPAYPRAEDATFEGETISADLQKPAFENPFAALAQWKDRLEKE